MADAKPVTVSAAPPALKERLLSLDFFRGLTMFFLIGESTLLYEHLRDPGLAGSVLHAIGTQLEHHPWAGLRVWDLVQPFFMFIVGTALAFSVAKREERGESRSKITKHVVIRSLLLLLLGWALYCIEPGRITFRFQNVLAQLGVTYPIAYFLMRKKAADPDRLELRSHRPDRDRLPDVSGCRATIRPSSRTATSGHGWTCSLGGELSAGHWVAFNAIPTAAHTIWGVLAGQWLMRAGRRKKDRRAGRPRGGRGRRRLRPDRCDADDQAYLLPARSWWRPAASASWRWPCPIGSSTSGSGAAWAVFFNIVGMNSLAIYLFTGKRRDGLGDGNSSGRSRMSFGGWIGELPAEILTSLCRLGGALGDLLLALQEKDHHQDLERSGKGPCAATGRGPVVYAPDFRSRSSTIERSFSFSPRFFLYSMRIRIPRVHKSNRTLRSDALSSGTLMSWSRVQTPASAR